jgi:hypothetical protein
MFNGAIDDFAEKVYFYEFVANVLRDGIGIVIFEAKKDMKEMIYQKYLIKVSQKRLSWSNQI